MTSPNRRDLRVDIIGNDRASSELDRVGKKADGLGKKFAGLGKTLALGVGGAAVAGIAGLGKMLADGAAEFQDNQKAMAQFTQGLKTTGNVAGITAEQMGELADSIEAKTGTDGAAVVSGAAMLTTFAKVRNEVGKGNDVFTRATQAGVDLAARGFGSVESNAVLLGKALNDPIKGLSALGKQGITFTAEQKKMIAGMVAAGDTLGAQKIILGEVEAQVKGSAEAFGKTMPGQIARAQAAFDGVKETLFKSLLPVFTQALNFLNTSAFPAFGRLAARVGVFTESMRQGTGVGGRLAAFFRAALPVALANGRAALEAVRGVVDRVRAALERNRPQLETLGRAFLTVSRFVGTQVVPVLGRLAGFLAGTFIDSVGQNVQRIASLAQRFRDAWSWARNFWTALTNIKVPQPIERLAGIIGGIAGGLKNGAGAVGRFFGVGDGPGRLPLSGGTTLGRVSGLLEPGTYVSSTYRTPARNRAVGGSPTSYHLDRANPAVDIAGPTAALDRLYARLRAIGGWRELLWRVPDHYDHLHVAHAGGPVAQSWPRMPGDRADERTARLQVGETVLPRGVRVAGGSTVVNLHVGGRHVGRTVVRELQGRAARGARVEFA